MLKKLFNKESIEDKLRAEMNTAILSGATRQSIEHRYLLESIELGRQWNNKTAVERGNALHILAVELGSTMASWIQDGINAENENRIDDAIIAYELAIKDEFMGQHPYERLRIIYRKQNKYGDAIRVCQIATNNPFMGDKKKAHFQKWIDKMMN